MSRIFFTVFILSGFLDLLLGDDLSTKKVGLTLDKTASVLLEKAIVWFEKKGSDSDFLLQLKNQQELPLTYSKISNTYMKGEIIFHPESYSLAFGYTSKGTLILYYKKTARGFELDCIGRSSIF